MSSPAPPSGLLTRESYVDWDDLSGLDKIVAIYQVGDSTVVVETSEGREVRITAWLDRGTRRYVADFERRTALPGSQLKVWAHTPAYARCVADDLLGCLEAAILAVDRVPVY
jgi:IS4 transposase